MISLFMTIKNWIPPTATEVKQTRTGAGLTQAKAAHLARVGLKTFQRWENDRDDLAPGQAAWTLFEFELRSQKIGFQSLNHLVEETENNLR